LLQKSSEVPQAKRLNPRIADVSPVFQDRRHFACVPSDSQAERLHPRIAGISPAFQDRRHFACVPSDSQAERLHPRIAGVSPASGYTQPQMREV
jgi:hypothetical protein